MQKTSAQASAGAQPGAMRSGRFGEPAARSAQRYTASVELDKRLAAFDIAASLAHARMLTSAGILGPADLAQIERGLAQIRTEIEAGTFSWSIELEDVHLNIERRLTQLVGDPGKRLHTARSRNDQVATDLRLFLRAAIDEVSRLIEGLQEALLDLAEPHTDTIMPGFTHLQVAQPVSFAHHLMAYWEMLQRDRERLADCRKRVNRLPLGAGALAGTSYPIDRAQVAEELGFEALCENSIDAVADRDFAVEFSAAAALIMVHLSRFSEELILWTTPRFAFIELGDAFCTGSSIMPQKRNPDVPEIARGKTGRVVGHLVALLMLIKAQPLAYNKDNQEDKEPLFDTVDTVSATLAVFTDMLGSVRVKREAMRAAVSQGHATATDLADYLVRKGMPFRDAHEVVARAVRHAEAEGCDLAALPLDTLQTFSGLIEADVFSVLTLEGSVASRKSAGGTAPERVREAIARARSALSHRREA